MKHYVYILSSETSGRRYIGHTANLEQRLRRHNEGQVPSTKKWRPWQITLTVMCESKQNALQVECYVKSLKKRDAAFLWMKQPSGPLAQLVRAVDS